MGFVYFKPWAKNSRPSNKLHDYRNCIMYYLKIAVKLTRRNMFINTAQILFKSCERKTWSVLYKTIRFKQKPIHLKNNIYLKFSFLNEQHFVEPPITEWKKIHSFLQKTLHLKLDNVSMPSSSVLTCCVPRRCVNM